MENKNLNTQEIYEILGDRRDKIRAFFGIAVDVLDVDNEAITIRVEQKKLINNYILNQSELVNRAGRLFNKIEGYRLRFKPLTYRPDFEEITIEWIKVRMDEFKIKRKDIIKQLNIDESSLSLYFSGNKKMENSQKAAFFYYFMTYELNRDGTLIFDNSYGKHELIAQKIEQEDILVFNKEKINKIKKYYDKKG